MRISRSNHKLVCASVLTGTWQLSASLVCWRPSTPRVKRRHRRHRRKTSHRRRPSRTDLGPRSSRRLKTRRFVCSLRCRQSCARTIIEHSTALFLMSVSYVFCTVFRMRHLPKPIKAWTAQQHQSSASKNSMYLTAVSFRYSLKVHPTIESVCVAVVGWTVIVHDGVWLL